MLDWRKPTRIRRTADTRMMVGVPIPEQRVCITHSPNCVLIRQFGKPQLNRGNTGERETTFAQLASDHRQPLVQTSPIDRRTVTSAEYRFQAFERSCAVTMAAGRIDDLIDKRYGAAHGNTILIAGKAKRHAPILRSCPLTWCKSAVSVSISGGVGRSVKQPERRAA